MRQDLITPISFGDRMVNWLRRRPAVCIHRKALASRLPQQCGRKRVDRDLVKVMTHRGAMEREMDHWADKPAGILASTLALAAPRCTVQAPLSREPVE